MKENVYFYFMHIHILFILSLVTLLCNTTTATSHGHQLVSATGQAVHKCIEKERQALLDFKAPLHDPYDMLSTWRHEDDDCCQWLGVTCNNQTGHVTELVLDGSDYNSSLEGEITLSLLNLTYLSHLTLDLNSFHGSIPKFISSMTRLTFLSLLSNKFTGSIPESIGNLTQLTLFDISKNNFSGTIPRSIGSLTSLIFLELSKNKFSGTIPRSIGSLTNLRFLGLSENNFSGSIPMSIGYLTKLMALSLHDNFLDGTIPTEFGNLTNLTELSLGSNLTVENLDWLSSFPSLSFLQMDGISLAKANNWVNAILGLRNLSTLSLNGCDLSKVMHPYSPSVNNYSFSLGSLYLAKNNLNSSMYRWLCTLNSSNLYVSGNKLDGKLSDFLNNLSVCPSAARFYFLDASSNQFTGSVSDEIQNFSSLIHLNLSSNQLDGTISDKLWQLPNLLTLYLSSNSLRGAITENFGKYSLQYIDLSNNSIEGDPFNDDVSNNSHSFIEYIDFSSNKLGPRFPKWIQTMIDLMHLDLSNNSISDTVSNQWKSSLLTYVDLSLNNFYGSIPAFPASIRFLDLSRNKFHGGLAFLCQLYKMEFLDLSRNTITGHLPDCIRNLTYLRVLNLGHNAISGSIPFSVGCLRQLETLSLYNNSFSGVLPVSLKDCDHLSLMDLGANNLYGDIPLWIGKNFSRLYALSLKSNSFFGSIPSQICQLVSLQILDLSDNNLYGTIPSCLNSLKFLVQNGLPLERNGHHYLSDFEFHSIIGGSIVISPTDIYIDHVMLKWQGKVNEFSKILGLVKTIDLSGNNLTGPIPDEVTTLQGLLVLDLSNNSLIGEIPRDIGQMAGLLTLNLSRNMFSGRMPSSMSDMHSLNDLDVSFNNLSGRVPSSTQLQSFLPERFTGNVGLCGPPTTTKCLEDEDQGVPPIGDSGELQRWFYIGGATGFATAFWIACSALLLNRRLRHTFFHFYDCLKDWVYVKVVVFIARLQRVAHA